MTPNEKNIPYKKPSLPFQKCYTVEPLYNRHFGTKFFLLVMQRFSSLRGKKMYLLGPKFFVYSSEVSVIQGVLKRGCTVQANF